MDTNWLALVLIVALIFVPPALLLSPLVTAIANRIAGKRADADDVKALKARVAALEQEVASLQTRVLSVEDTAQFAKVLQDKERSRDKSSL